MEINKDANSLISELESEDGITRVKARKALVECGEDCTLSLVEAMKNKNDWARWEAAKTLAEVGDIKAIQALINAMEDHEFSIRWLAAEGLIKIGSPAVEPVLEALFSHPESVWVREGAHHVLHDLWNTEFRENIRPVIVALEDMDASMKAGIAAKTALDTIRK